MVSYDYANARNINKTIKRKHGFHYSDLHVTVNPIMKLKTQKHVKLYVRHLASMTWITSDLVKAMNIA